MLTEICKAVKVHDTPCHIENTSRYVGSW